MKILVWTILDNIQFLFNSLFPIELLLLILKREGYRVVKFGAKDSHDVESF